MKFFSLKGDTRKNPVCVSPWSFMHLYSGIISIVFNIYILKLNGFFVILFFYNMIHILYEIFDYLLTYNKFLYKLIKIKKDCSILNSICDSVIYCIGLLIGYYLFYIKKYTFFRIVVILYVFSFYMFYKYLFL